MNNEERLVQFEKMKKSIEDQHADIVNKMDRLRAEGRQKSATYMQLMANKMTFENMLKLYELYDID
ncbi:hypothetical protein [Emergencia sp.]|uniref:hypothetical protein n=1 Tax=Emergencia sp. TaxID=1926557 RepID=UPI003AF1CC48